MINIIKSIIKFLLRDDSHCLTTFEGHTLWKHDVEHILVSRLQPISIMGHKVDGISGINIPEFHADPSIKPAYDGLLDEVRVGVHQWLKYPYKPYSWVIIVNYVVYMLRKGINPVPVIKQHWDSMN